MVKLGGFTEAEVLRRAKEACDRGEAKVPLRPEKTALLVVDMLDEFVKPNWAPYWVPEATRQAPRIRHLQEVCRQLGVPVINIGYDTSMMGKNFPATLACVPIGSGLAEFAGELFTKVAFYPEVAPKPGDLTLLKHAYTSFYGTPLETVLRNLGADTVIVCGTQTNYCCGATAREAFWRGFKVVFGSDINSTDDEECHRAELRTMRRGYARVMKADEIIKELTENAKG